MARPHPVKLMGEIMKSKVIEALLDALKRGGLGTGSCPMPVPVPVPIKNDSRFR